MYINYFDKFKGMTPYLRIEANEWTHIKATFDINDVKESLADVAMTYELPYAEISEDEARKEYLALKGIRWNNLFTEGEWFPRKASEFRYSLDRSSYLYSITDLGAYKESTTKKIKKLIGIGAGYQFKINNNFVNIGYVISTNSSTNAELNSSRLVVRWTSFFY